MTANSPQAFFLSAAFHGGVIAVLLLLSYVAGHSSAEPPRAVFELVAGEGDNYGAKVAPKLGSPDGSIKVDLPKMPEVKPAPEPPAPVPPAPIQAAKPEPSPVKKAVEPAKAPPTTPNFARQARMAVIRAESKAKKEIAKERAAEEKRLEEERKKQQQMSKAEFDRLNKKGETSKVARLDPKGIAKGVTGGSTENDVGGARGKALRNDSDDVLGNYFQFFKDELKRNFEPPPGLSDTLMAEVEVRSNADGTFTNARILRSSGNKDFDRAVLDAIHRTRVGPRPDGKSDAIRFPFTMKDQSDG